MKLLLVDAEALLAVRGAIQTWVERNNAPRILRLLTPQPDGDAVPFEKYRDETLEAMAKIVEKATNNLASCRSENERLCERDGKTRCLKCGSLLAEREDERKLGLCGVCSGYLHDEMARLRAEVEDHDRTAGEAVKLMREYGEENDRLRDALLGLVDEIERHMKPGTPTPGFFAPNGVLDKMAAARVALAEETP